MRVEVLKRHPYGNRTYEVGETYEMEDRFVATLTTTGHVRAIQPETREMTADKPPKLYKTRDMKSR